MTKKEKLIDYLNKNPGYAFCDDCLAKRTEVSRRQQINSLCRQMAVDGLLLREKGICYLCHKDKLTNMITQNAHRKNNYKSNYMKYGVQKSEKPWFWEGNVQSAIIRWLENHGYRILSTAETIARTKGIDIVAKSPMGKSLLITVKGYPENKKAAQARHYFAEAIFDLVLYKGKYDYANLAVGLPAGFSTYSNLAKEIERFRRERLPFDIFWVYDDGKVLLDN